MCGKKIEMLIESTTKIEIFYGYDKVDGGVLCNSVSIAVNDGKCSLNLFVPSEQGTEALEEKVSEPLI